MTSRLWRRVKLPYVCAAVLGVMAISGVACDTARGQEEAGNSAPTPPPQLKGTEVLFGGKKSELTDNWVIRDTQKPANWRFSKGVLFSAKNDIETKEKFTDFQLHVEFREPNLPNEHGQAKGNSGVFLCEFLIKYPAHGGE